MKKKKKPGIFFTNPSDKDVSEGTKNTVETFVEAECDPADTDHLTGDFKRIIDVKFGGKKKREKRI